ncbi:UNVERIFIED_CONTAM: hypothetical protein FKN15_063752 [Acipenser sinensis]
MAMHSGVDTKMLRKAVWNYIHCVFGILFDDYDYGDVNHLLERSLKVYIKTVACYPEKTSYRMYHAFWRHFRHSEKSDHMPPPCSDHTLHDMTPSPPCRVITRYVTPPSLQSDHMPPPCSDHTLHDMTRPLPAE